MKPALFFVKYPSLQLTCSVTGLIEKSMRNKAIGNFIKSKRLAKNISTKEVAKSLNTSVEQYTQYENGETSIYIDDLIKIADIVDVSVQELFYEYSK